MLFFGLITGRLKLDPKLFQIFLAVGLISLCVPLRMLGFYGMDFRLPLLAAMLLLSAISTTERASTLFRNTIVCGVVLMTFGRSFLIFNDLQKSDNQIDELRRVISAMPKGMRLLTVEQLRRDPMHLSHHAPLFAIIDRDAFMPTLFTGIGTVKPEPEVKMLCTPSGSPYPDLAALVDGYGRTIDPTSDIPGGKGAGSTGWAGSVTSTMYW